MNNKINKDEIILVINNLEKILPIYKNEIKDLISRTIVIEQQLIRLNHQMLNIRNMLDNKK